MNISPDFKSSLNAFRTLSGNGKFNGFINVNLNVLGNSHRVRLFLVSAFSSEYDMIIGLDLIKLFKLRQDENLNISSSLFSSVPSSLSQASLITSINSYETFSSVLPGKLSHLPVFGRQKISNLISQFSTLFASSKFDIGTVRDHVAHIKLSVNKYVYRKPYRCSIEDSAIIEREVQDLLAHDLIEPSTSPFASPVTLAYKKDEGEKSRLCIDFKELNKIVVPQAHPFPLIDDILLRIRDCKWFSSLDINRAFWSIPVRPKDRYKTAFVTQQGHYR